MLTVTKKFEFCYGHFLPGYHGKCKEQHGHNATLEVEVSGTGKLALPKHYEGMVIDFSDIKHFVNGLIIDVFDHKNINNFIKIPTAENMVVWIVQQLRQSFGQDLVRVRLYETNDSYAEWRKE